MREREPTDIIMLTHNRLDHLEAMVDALEARTRAPYRLTIVDNASGPEVRNWLAANRHRFHQIIWQADNQFLGALNHGIAATTSDPYMVTDPDLILPDLEPCWLTRMLDAMDRHPEFGLLGPGLDQSNLPPVQEPESIAPEEIVDGEIVARPVGSGLTLIRRAALPPSTAPTGTRARVSSAPATATAGARDPRVPPGLGRLQASPRSPDLQARPRPVPRGGADRPRADAA